MEFAKLRCTEAERRMIRRYQENRAAILERYERFTHKRLPKSNYYFRLKMRAVLSLVDGQRMVLYGAGKYGRQVHRYLHLSGNAPVQWLDKRAHELQNQGCQVDGDITMLGRASYDIVLIAVADKQTVAHIKEEMVGLGVPPKVIFSLAEAVESVTRYFSAENIYPRMFRIKLK